MRSPSAKPPGYQAKSPLTYPEDDAWENFTPWLLRNSASRVREVPRAVTFDMNFFLTPESGLPRTGPVPYPGIHSPESIISECCTTSHDRKVERVHDHITKDVPALLRQHEPILKKRFGIVKIGIFGSFVRGEQWPDSDVDVPVTFRKGEKTLDHYRECRFYLENLFRSNVDRVMKGTIRKRLKPSIPGEVVYA